MNFGARFIFWVKPNSTDLVSTLNQLIVNVSNMILPLDPGQRVFSLVYFRYLQLYCPLGAEHQSG